MDKHRPDRFRSPICQPGYRKGLASPNAGKTFPAEVLTRSEIFRLLEATNNGPSGARNRAIIVTLWRTGLRVMEACALRPIDVDHQARTVRVLRGKTAGSNRLVGIDAGALEVVADWQEAREALGVPRLSNLFCTIQRDHLGFPLSTAHVRNMLRHLADKAGIEKRVHPHAFRHTHAAEMANEKVDIRFISKQLGHASILTTHRYVDHLNPQAVIDAIAGRPEW